MDKEGRILKTKFNDGKLELEIFENSKDTIKINLINLNYEKQRKSNLKIILILLLIFTIYISSFNRKSFIDFFFAIALIGIVYSTINLVKKDSVAFYSGVALQMSTIYFLNRKLNSFIPHNYIFDVILNEVILNLNIKYILMARTKGSVFEEKPLIQLMPRLNPGVDCLQIIYKHLRRKIIE